VIKLKRTEIAERIYRITGEGIYRDTALAGRKPPIEQPLLNGGITGTTALRRSSIAGESTGSLVTSAASITRWEILQAPE
jgi:hypothetical protein